MTYTVRAQGRLQTEEEFGAIAIRSNPDGSVIRLRDVARVELGALNYQQIGRVNGQPGCSIAVFQAPGSNALDVAEGVRAQMDALHERFPEDLEFGYTLDTTRAVSEGIREILITLAEAMVLVVLVVYLFLQNWRATLIPIIAVPVSLIGTFMVFPALGFSLNTLSLFGLVLAIGLVVDDAIVVVEAVEHHIEEGMAPREATIKAMDEVSGPVVSIALILAAVFIPVGVHGRHPGQPEQAVRADHRHRDADLGLQRADAVAGAGGDVAAAAHATTRWGGSFFGWFNRSFDRAANGYVARQPRADPQGGARRRDPGRLRRPRRRAGPAACRPASCPRRTTATSCSTCSCRRRRRCSAPTTWPARSRRSSTRRRRSRTTAPSSASAC